MLPPSTAPDTSPSAEKPALAKTSDITDTVSGEHVSDQTLTPAGYWKKTQRLTLVLLGSWFGMTFLVVFFARQLDHIHLFGWPLSFYMAAQGMMLIYLAIVVIYTLKMGRADQQLQQLSES